MNVGKVVVNTAHRKWCQDFINEQNKTTRLIRHFIKRNSAYNPFGNYKEVDKILNRYEKSFWG